MTVEKVSISLDAEVLAETRERVGRRGLSAYVTDAVRRQLRRDALSNLLAGMREVNGSVPDDQMEEVRRLWPAPVDEAGHRRA